MKRVIKNKKKMKNTMYIVFGVFASALFGVTMMNPSYASEGLMIDDALYMIAEQTITSDNMSEEDSEVSDESLELDEDIEDIEDPELTPDEKALEGDENSQDLELDEDDNNDNEYEENLDGKEVDNGENDKNEDGDKEGKTEESDKTSETEEGDNQTEVLTPENPAEEENHGVSDENFVKLYDGELENSRFIVMNNDLSIYEENENNPYIVYDEENGLITVYSEDFSYGITLQDKNLGAENVGDYGNYYQRSNNEPIDPSNYSNISNTSSNARGGGNDNYSSTNIIKGYDTINHVATNVENRRGPCNAGYHVPSMGEFSELIKLYANAKQINNLLKPGDDGLYGMSDLDNEELDFNKDMKIVYGGWKNRIDRTFENVGTVGNYWSSTPSTDGGYRYYTKVGKKYIRVNRKDGASILMSVRCFKNRYNSYPKTVTYHPNGGAFSGMDKNETKEYTYNYSGTEIIPIYNIQIPDMESEDISQQSGWMFAGWYTKDGSNNDWGEEFDPATSTTNIAYAKWLPFNDLVITMGNKTFIIMDRNMGAKNDDEGIYSNEGNYDNDKIGYYYQWGNNYGFKGGISNSNSITSTIDAHSFDSSTFYNNKYVIRNSSESYLGRDMPVNMNLRGQSEMYDESRKGPCPRGYHIPKEVEWNKVIEIFNNWKSSDECSQFYTNYSFSSSNYCLAKKLRLPYVSYIGTNGVYYGDGKTLRYRSSNHDTYPADNPESWKINARYFEFRLSSNSIFVGQNFKSQALPIRCFKDEVKKIVYETNGGYFDNTPVTITTWWGENIRSLIAPKKNDLPNVFGGWYTTENFEEGTFVTGSNLKSDTDEIKLYAKWDANIFTLSFNADNNDTNPGNITVTYDSQYPELPVVTRTGYTFDGWYNGEEKINSGDVVQITEDTTLKARRETNKYKIIFDTDGGNEINPIEKDYNSSLSGMNLPTPTKECNEFSGWDVELPETMPAHDITLKAIWNYTCSRSSGGGGRKSETTTREIAIYTNTENEHNSADEKENNTEISEENKTTLNDEKSSQVISVTQEVSEDGTVEAIVETVKIENTDIIATVRTEVNSSNSSSGSSNSSSNSTTHTKEQKDAYSFAKSNGITTTKSIETAKMDTELTRIQMAKMVSNYAINVLGQEPDTSKGTVQFKDVTEEMNKQYDNAVTKAYQLGIMGQNVNDNKFRPNDEVSRAEFSATLSRLLYHTEEGKYRGTGKYYVPHIAKLYNEGIINKVIPTMKERRGYVMTMLMRTVK